MKKPGIAQAMLQTAHSSFVVLAQAMVLKWQADGIPDDTIEAVLMSWASIAAGTLTALVAVDHREPDAFVAGAMPLMIEQIETMARQFLKNADDMGLLQ